MARKKRYGNKRGKASKKRRRSRGKRKYIGSGLHRWNLAHGRGRRRSRGKGKHKGKHRFGARRSRAAYRGREYEYKEYMELIQSANGTMGEKPTAEERAQVESALYAARGPGQMTPKEQLKKRFAAEKRALVKKMASELKRKTAREVSRQEDEAAVREAEAELRDI